MASRILKTITIILKLSFIQFRQETKQPVVKSHILKAERHLRRHTEIDHYEFCIMSHKNTFHFN